MLSGWMFCFVPMLRLVDKTRFFRRAESLEDVVVGVLGGRATRVWE